MDIKLSNKFSKTLLLCSVLLFALKLTGCATVPLHTETETLTAKEFKLPSENKSGIYIYREDSIVGSALYKDVYIDNLCVGETAPGTFFYTEVDGDKSHTFSTESEFSPNELSVYTVAGKNYFFEQYIKLGIFVGGADIKQVSEEEGKSQVSKLDMAIKGTCSNM